MILDSFYEACPGKRICQDYAFCDHDNAHVVLSDGCGSGRETHIGAMITARVNDKNDFLNMKKMLKLSDEDLYATRIGLTRETYNMAGDGVVVTKQNDKYRVIQVNFSYNAPLYPAYYWLDKMEEYKNAFPDQKVELKSTILDKDLKILSYELYQIKDFGGFTYGEHDGTAFAFSDGIESFVDQEGTQIETAEVLKYLLKFPGEIKEGCLQRRWGFAKKEFNKLGWTFRDDISGILLKA